MAMKNSDSSNHASLCVPAWNANGCSIERVAPTPDGVSDALARQLAALHIVPAPGERWAVKLNLTYPEYIPGVVNAPAFVTGLAQWAADARVKLIFVEGDGGNGAYSALDTLEGNGVAEIAQRHGMAIHSLSEAPGKAPWQWRQTTVCGKEVNLPYSQFLVQHEFDRFVTTPLFKNHIFTTVSLGMKNLWGCIPDAYRMYYHHLLDWGIVALAKELQPDFAIFDGLVALRGRGPMDGNPLAMSAVMTAGSIGVGEAAALQIMGLNTGQVRHLRLAEQEGIVPPPGRFDWLSDPAPFGRHDFVVQRSLLNHASIWLGASPALQTMVYHSHFSRSIYRIVDRLRPHSNQAQLVAAKRSQRYHVVPFDPQIRRK
jgi:uncharacterized protein (DUF362 family)